MRYLCLISLLIASTSAYSKLNHLLLNLDLQPHHVRNVQEKWIEQKLDHFDPRETRTIKTRYFENLSLWKPNGPIFISIGGEGTQQPIWIANYPDLLTTQLAIETNGAMFATEHRYYGESLPNIPNHDKPEYYKFLSAPQAMEDIKTLISMLKQDPRFRWSKVVMVGASYAGNLATWMREMYPNLVDAAVAANAPVLAKKDFHEYLDVVRNTFQRYGSENCLSSITYQFQQLEVMLQTPRGQQELKRRLNICASCDMSVLENQQYMFNMLYNRLKLTAQYGLPFNVTNICQDSYKPTFIRDLLGPTLFCRSFDNSAATRYYVDAFRYQMCTEFGYLQTTSSEQQPFVHWDPVNYEVKFCNSVVRGNVEEIMDRGIARTNQMFGGLRPRVTRVVFTQGDMDPWHALGILKDLGPEAPSIMIPGTSHGAIMAAHLFETPVLTQARQRVKELVKRWISSGY